MLKARSILYSQVRFKNIRWSVLRKKKYAIDKALESFDDFYGSVYGDRWKNMRVALLTENKYVAFVNNFGDVEKTKEMLENEGAININSLVKIAKGRSIEFNGTSSLNDNHGLMNKKIEQMIEKQTNKDISSIYPKNAIEDGLVNSKKINFSGCDANEIETNENSEEKVDYKTSLKEAIENHSDIDKNRLIDSEYGLTTALHEYVPTTRIKGMEDWIPESNYYKYYPTNVDFPLQIELEKNFKFPENLLLYTYEMGNISEFVEPRNCSTGVLSHFLMDGGSILPPLFLGLEYGDVVLDACAAPGGKSLIMLQTFYPEILICNDVQESRINRIKRIMNQYIYEYQDKWNDKRCHLTLSNAGSITDFDKYDKILVDVPCTTDRHAVIENDNNIFKSTRIKERLRIPELQSSILTNCLRLLKPGGTLIYSTCSLSPVQNDGVVHMSLQKAFNEYGITVTIKDLSLTIKLFNDIFKFENSKNLKYGQMVLPYLPANFGPMYFCKIQRNT